MANITVTNLTFAWEGSSDNVFEDVSFHFDTDWRVGLIGRNGRGKSTLLKLLAEEMPHGGAISSPVKFRYFPFAIKDPARDTLDVIDGVCPGYEFWELCREMNLLGVPEEVLFRPFDTLSPGEQIKTLIATLFIGGDDFILLDEPTNHLDAAGKRIVTEYLRKKRSFIIVSHDRALLDAVCDHMVSIGKTGVEVMAGNYSVWAEEKRRRDARELSENEKLAKDVSRLTASARATKNWSDKVESTKTGAGPVDRGYIGHKSAKMMKRSKTLEARRQSAIEQKNALLNDVERAGNLKMTPLPFRQKVLAEATDLCIEYLPNLRETTLRVEKGERIALTGGNGSGKSSILKLFACEDIPHTGTVKTASGLVISYVPQAAPAPGGDLRRFAADAGVDLTMFFTILRNLGLTREALDSDMSDLSDGMKRKALLARSLCESAHLYLWDEPLNFVDILSREQVEELILTYEPTMLFVEHDETFARRVATRFENIQLMSIHVNV